MYNTQWQEIDSTLLGSVLGDLADSLECSVCAEIMVMPVISSCGHSFCYECCSSWFENKATCPTCRHELDTPPALNVVLKDISHRLVDVLLDQSSLGDNEKQELKLRQENSRKTYQFDMDHGRLYGDAFNSVVTMIDRSDGVARCANCHWEAHGSQCGHCGAVFRIPREEENYHQSDDAFSDSEDQVSEERDNRYDSEDSFVDNGSDTGYHIEEESDGADSWAGLRSPMNWEDGSHDDVRHAVDRLNRENVSIDVDSDTSRDGVDYRRTAQAVRRRVVISDSEDEVGEPRAGVSQEGHDRHNEEPIEVNSNSEGHSHRSDSDIDSNESGMSRDSGDTDDSIPDVFWDDDGAGVWSDMD
ncbi:E3 ubiquitin ligase [Yamadazyma tenuis]|uniref:RING-type domain-containing protein n=1 Tax=Candida tenuis (strain ATCC 10573 / BCRC 21748 / CBS 615 / JCM 9827 / NBRC 10315 / NRRL Y-1498 / VKM Y-70) TaxID=590646 RepID=G3B3T1_CANTC|nr:uncharacterized protein CANTEDRAFT_93238 [Yamadazyma tenuis ATCC 10573]EGV63724.1 hypothetical protein CANTEDRAFT_93238 [Yamadazyma tenuis ATCC 10573]WEJ96665.1 E3 ubiquitin ligase [Yamadazyma tenuis]